jgi:hypothetical protein
MLTAMACQIATIPNRPRHGAGYTALEALVLLVVLAALAITSLAVYQKMEADATVTQTPAAQNLKPQEPASQPPAESIAAPSAKTIR